MEFRERKLQDHLAKAQKSSADLKAMEGSLHETIELKMRQFEKEYKQWNIDDAVQWILMIENNRFKAPQFGAFIERLKEMEIDGKELCELNSKFALNVAGLSLQSDQHILRKHISRLIDLRRNDEPRNVCGVCVKNVVNTAILPCGHQYYCHHCSKKERGSQCPICRKRIDRIVQTFMSGFSK